MSPSTWLLFVLTMHPIICARKATLFFIPVTSASIIWPSHKFHGLSQIKQLYIQILYTDIITRSNKILSVNPPLLTKKLNLYHSLPLCYYYLVVLVFDAWSLTAWSAGSPFMSCQYSFMTDISEKIRAICSSPGLCFSLSRIIESATPWHVFPLESNGAIGLWFHNS